MPAPNLSDRRFFREVGRARAGKWAGERALPAGHESPRPQGSFPAAARKEQLWEREAREVAGLLPARKALPSSRAAHKNSRESGWVPPLLPPEPDAPHPEGGPGIGSSASAAIRRGKPTDAPSSWRNDRWRRIGWGGAWGARRRAALPAFLPEAAARKGRPVRESSGAKHGSRLSMTDGNCSGALTRKSGSTAGWRSCTEDGKMRCQMKSILMISWRWTQMRRGPRNYRAPWSHATTTRRTSPESCWRS